ncbi:unnamed protein product [Cyclocybe aegerita]|uniref:Uncharacterized protein n=1 Tax=Cyclocybe aegerita TaxID=1973307 RepID=A0A8S0W8R3_CYCAE|nr:unnamed protein product [Cyclocybe aegerita]
MARATRAQARLAPPPEIPLNFPNDLPAPSTSRTLRPRSRATSLARPEDAGSRSRPGSRASSTSHGSSASASVSRSTSRMTSLAQAHLPMDQDMSSAGGSENNRVEPTEQPGGSSEMNVSPSSPEQFVQRSTVRRWSPQPYAAIEAAWDAAGFAGFPPLPMRGNEALSLAGSNHFPSTDAHISESSSYPAPAGPSDASSSSGKRKREHTLDSEDEPEATFSAVNWNEELVAGPSSLSTALQSPASSSGKRKRDPDSNGETDSIPSVPPSQEPSNLSQQSSHAESENEIAEQLSLNDGYVSDPMFLTRVGVPLLSQQYPS